MIRNPLQCKGFFFGGVTGFELSALASRLPVIAGGVHHAAGFSFGVTAAVIGAVAVPANQPRLTNPP